MTAVEETLRSTVGRDAAVPRKRTVSDMGAEYNGDRSSLGLRFASVRCVIAGGLAATQDRCCDLFGTQLFVARFSAPGYISITRAMFSGCVSWGRKAGRVAWGRCT
jgi:hypothetical protein